MSQPIVVNTDEVQRIGAAFLSKKTEVEDLVRRADGQMKTLQSEFKGMRATKINTEWGDMYPRLTQAISSLEQAGKWLESAAADFTQVDTKAL
jgi:WXG100 family type VII secretion target